MDTTSKSFQAESADNLNIIAEIELVYKPHFSACDRPRVNHSADSYSIFKSNWNLGTIALRTEFRVMFLNATNNVLGILTLNFGNIDKALIDVRLLFGAALKAGASAIITAHNRPSGELKTSTEDINLVRQIKSAADTLSIKYLDHITLTAQKFHSYADEGML